jgi:hypothetical protein
MKQSPGVNRTPIGAANLLHAGDQRRNQINREQSGQPR